MECTSCGPAAVRKDRPHTFFMHEMAVCPGCAMPIESRVVLRDDAVVRLIHCTQCGPSEQAVAPDAKAYVASFVARGEAPAGHEGDYFLKHSGCVSSMDADGSAGGLPLNLVLLKVSPSVPVMLWLAVNANGNNLFTSPGTNIVDKPLPNPSSTFSTTPSRSSP